MNRTVKQYLDKFFASLHASALIDSNEIRTHYYKLPFVGSFSTHVQRRIKNLTQRYCKNLDIKLVFAPYKIKNLFSAKDAISKLSRSRVVYKFSCAGCSACYVGETNRHLAIQKFGFINGVDNVNWPPYRDSKRLLESLYGGQFTLSTPFIKPNFCILLPHRRSTTVSLETTPSTSCYTCS